MNIEEAIDSLKYKIKTFKTPEIDEELDVLKDIFNVFNIPFKWGIQDIFRNRKHLVIDCNQSCYYIPLEILSEENPLRAARIFRIKNEVDSFKNSIATLEKWLKVTVEF